MGKIRNNIKMRVTPEQSQKVQEICFEEGISWFSGKVLKHLDKPYFYINGDSELGYSDKDSQLFFIEDDREEVSAELFIRTNGTCVESEAPTKDNKGEQMEEQKLECLVKGYEGTYFEVGQVWLTAQGSNKVKIVQLNRGKTILVEGKLIRYSVQLNGEFNKSGLKSDLDLVKLISTETTQTETTPKEPQPKTLSEYLKENNAYGSFIENCVARALENPKSFLNKKEKYRSKNYQGNIGDFFIWGDTPQGNGYWINLELLQPNNIVYDMNEIVFAEVEKRLKLKAISENPNDFLTKDEIEALSTLPKQPKTLSEYLKENNAYESFVENSVEAFLKDLAWYKVFKSENKSISLGNTFIWEDSKEGQKYWHNLSMYKPENLVYDMNEIIFTEVDGRIAEQTLQPEFISTEEFNQMLEQKSTTKYMVFVEGRSNPKHIHDSYDSAEKEAKRLAEKEIGCNVFVVEIIKTFKSKVIVEEV